MKIQQLLPWKMTHMESWLMFMQFFLSSLRQKTRIGLDEVLERKAMLIIWFLWRSFRPFFKKGVTYLRKFLSTRPFQRKIILSRSKVIPVTTNSELESAIKNSTLERCRRALSNVGERHIILLREGSENLLSAITHIEMAIHWILSFDYSSYQIGGFEIFIG